MNQESFEPTKPLDPDTNFPANGLLGLPVDGLSDGTFPKGQRVLNDPEVLRIRDQAELDFSAKQRKVPKGSPLSPLPYFTHLEAVAGLLAEAGYGEEVVKAGYLHDHLEDLPEQYNKATLAAVCGEAAATLVDWVTQQDKSLSWNERTLRYADRLKTDPDEACAISCADKISNMMDSLVLLRLGYPVSTISKAGWQANSEKYHELLNIFKGRVVESLVEKYTVVLDEYDRLGKAVDGSVA